MHAMVSVKGFLVLAICTILISGCAVNPTKVQANLAGRSLGISVCLKDQLNNKWIGTTIFNNGDKQQAVPSIGLARAAMEAGIEVVKVKNSGVMALDGCLNWKTAPRPPAGAAVLLAINEGYVQDQIAGTNQGQSGVGVFQRTAFGTKPFGSAHAVLEIKLTDIITGKSLGTTTCVALGSQIVLDDSLTLSADDLARNIPQFRELTKISVRRCLTDLGFEPIY